MSKKLFGKFFIFLLVVGLLFAVAPTGQAQAAAVVTTEAGLREALADPSVTQIELGASFALSATVDVNRSVAIDGKDFTITGPAKGTEAWEGHGLVVTANNVSISNLTITGSGRSNLVFYNVTGGSATNVILSNAAHAGMIVNSSAVTISNVTTTNNTWGGINVDQGSGLTTTPLLTVLGVTTHTSPTGRITPAIWVDTGNAAWVSSEDGLYASLTAPALLYYDNAEFAAATVFNVRTGVKYPTIQAAIDAALAGDAIYVPAGIYAEDVTVAKPLALLGAGRDQVTIQGQLTGEAAALELKANSVIVNGFEIKGAVGGKKTVRITTATDGLQFLNNRVVTASNTGGANAWSGFEVTYGTEQTNHVIDNNIFVGNGTSQLVYYGQNATNIKFTNNTITGTMMTGGLVAGFEGLNGSQVISGNTFDIESTYALFEAYGTYDIVAIFNANTWPDGFIASGNKVVPASVVYPSTNDNNRTQGWAHVDFVSADATAKTITLKFFPNPTLGHFVSCFERRSDGDTSQILTENGGVNYNPLILDGLYPYSCYYGDSGTTYLRTIPVLDYVEIRLPFGAESDERFYWAKFELIDQVWVDDDFTSATPGWGVDHFAVIQDGIAAVAEGGIVNVAAGTYVGPLKIDKQLSLLGPNATINPNTASRNPEAVVVYPSGLTTDADLVTVTADGVLIDGFTFDGKDLGDTLWGEGVFAEANNLSVKNNIIKNFMQIGIRIYSNIAGPYYSGALIENNKVISDVAGRYFSYSGIYLQGTHGVVRGNVVDDAYRGIQIQPYNHPSTELGIVEYNTFSAYKSPIYFNYSVSPTSNWIFRYNIANGIASLETAPVAYFSGIEVQTFQGGNVVFEKNQINLGTANGTINYLYKETGEVGGTSSATPNWWGSALGPQTEVSGIADFSPWCEDAECTTFLPDDDGKVTISGAPFTQTGAIKLYVDGVNYYLPAGTVIKNSSPCFEVYADDIKIYTDYPAAAACVPTNGSDGIWVADGVQSLRVIGLEFDGTDQTTGDGIHFAGVVTNFQIIENYFHDLDGDAIEFVGAPAGTIQDVYGNYFVGTNRITLGAGTLNATYNSWGTYAVPAAPAGVTVAPHTHAEIYVTPAVGGEVLKDTQVVFTVNGKIQSLTGAEFELSYPAELDLVSAVANETTWDQYALVDTSVDGKITVALSANAAVSGDPVEMLTLTFKALDYADDLTLTFSETADVFAMYPLPEPNYSNYVYTFAQTGVTNLDIIGLPVVTITMDPAPYYAGVPIPFEVEVDNTNGGTYTGLLFDIDLPALSVLEYLDGTDWVAAVPTFAVGSLAPDQILTFDFRVTLDQPGNNTIVVDLMDGTDLIGSDSVTITIAGNFNVLGTFAMQGRTVRDDIPVTFTLGSYRPTFMSVDQLLNNLSGTLQYGGTYLITTNQARYLNVTADLLKDMDVYADVTLPSLTLRAGNAVWTGHATSNNQIDLADANQIGTDWWKTGSDSLIINYGDVNFDNIVNIQDLALVGGNYSLTNTGAYGTWLP